MLSDAPPAKKFQFVGGDLCLDFCNTLGGKRGGVTREYLNSYDNFLSWSQQAGLLLEGQDKSLVIKAARHSSDAAVTLARGLQLREAIYRIFAASMDGNAPPGSDLSILNAELARALGRLRVVSLKGTREFTFEWFNEENTLDHPLGPIARSAAQLLTAQDALGHVRICNGQNCGWLFIDSSKNHSRRWCDMRDCGNRAKVRRHRMKHPAG